ncbi:trigger factor [Methylomonas sp. AM2-LC]|uniref:trigger factor n=1 Tax=Methylomonas sp. AM2-LC TaxID=3153301 RepID=UPI0032675F21
MQVSVEKTSELSRKMTVSIPDAIVQEKMESRLKKLAREVKVDGFRPGKVPAHVVKKLYGDRVKGEITGDLVESSYFEALKQENINPAGQPHIQPLAETEGFAYVAEFEVYPEISLDNINQLQVIRPLANITEDDVDTMIEKLRQQKKTWQEVDRASAEGDNITINFSGVSEGENFTGGKVENSKIEIGSQQMIPGFEDELKGLSAGAVKTFSATFPEQYHSSNLAGKTAEFEIEVVKVEASVLPEVDAEFIKAYGVDAGEITEFRADVSANMERELQQGLKNKLKSSVFDNLLTHITVPLPKAMIDQEMQQLLQPYAEQAKKRKVKLEDLNLSPELFESQAKRRVALGLIFSEVIQKNKLTIDADKVRAVITDMAKSYEQPEDVVNWYYADQSRLNDVQQMVLEDQAIDWLVSQAQVTDQTFSFSEVMEKQQTEA